MAYGAAHFWNWDGLLLALPPIDWIIQVLNLETPGLRSCCLMLL
jgi:hypothetical protein